MQITQKESDLPHQNEERNKTFHNPIMDSRVLFLLLIQSEDSQFARN